MNENAEFLDASFDYNDRWLSHFPTLGKQPAVLWKPYQERHPTAGERLSWWGHLSKTRYDIAIVTGQISGVMAFDIDSPETWRKLYDELKLPRTDMMVRSQNGRGHAYYQLPKDLILGNRVKILGVACDIRGEGGYCVAPPSRHISTGEPYQRIGDWNMAKVPLFDPEWLTEEQKAETPKIQPLEPRSNVSNLDRYLSRIPSIQGQGGNKGLFRACCVSCDELGNFDSALEAVKRWNESGAAVPAWSEKDIVRCLTSAFERKQNAQSQT